MVKIRGSLGCSLLTLILAGVSTIGSQPEAGARAALPPLERSKRINLCDDKIHPALEALYAADDRTRKVWVFFTDKGHPGRREMSAAIEGLEKTYNQRAVRRRSLRRTRAGLFDELDLPVSSGYRRAVTAGGAKAHVESRWLNAISVSATRGQVGRIAQLPFVKSIEPVRTGRLVEPVAVRDGIAPEKDAQGAFYGASFDQIVQINLAALHDAGFTGQGVVIGILDTGFKRTHDAFNDVGHPLQVVTEYDFVNDDPVTVNEAGDPSSQHNHGTWILGTLGSYLPGTLVGAAYDASFILCKTEDVSQEVIGEEDQYVAGLEFIEANGGDVVTSSLGYIDWYTQDDLDGLTAITTRAVNIAISNGLFCCNAMGNEGHDSDPDTSHFIAPADAFGVISCGAADSSGVIAGFSSDGPTAALVPQDRRVKPELLARGVSTQTVSVSSDTLLSGVSGTSLSTPLVAGAVACLVQARPEWTVSQMRNFLFQTAGDFVANGQPDPMFVRGFGFVDAYRAARAPCPADGDFSGDVTVVDLLDLLGGWGPCPPPESACPGDIDFTGTIDIVDLLDLLGQWGDCP